MDDDLRKAVENVLRARRLLVLGESLADQEFVDYIFKRSRDTISWFDGVLGWDGRTYTPQSEVATICLHVAMAITVTLE